MDNQHTICINSSKQGANIGVSGYGTEKKNAHIVGYRVKEILDWNGGFNKVYCTPETMTLSEGIKFSNDVNATVHVDIHSNANDKRNRGCMACYKSIKGKSLALCIYNEVSQLTTTADDGLRLRTDLGALNQTKAVAALIEMFYHDNVEDVLFYESHKEEFARAIAKGIIKYCGVTEIKEVVSKPTYKTVTASVLNVRSTPDSTGSSNIIGKLQKGSLVHVGFNRGDWTNIYFGDKGGWIASMYIK